MVAEIYFATGRGEGLSGVWTLLDQTGMLRLFRTRDFPMGFPQALCRWSLGLLGQRHHLAIRYRSVAAARCTPPGPPGPRARSKEGRSARLRRVNKMS